MSGDDDLRPDAPTVWSCIAFLTARHALRHARWVADVPPTVEDIDEIFREGYRQAVNDLRAAAPMTVDVPDDISELDS